MPRLLIMPLALASNGTVLVNVREFFPDPMPSIIELLPHIAEPIFVGVPATETEVRRALRRLAHGHREAAGFLVGGRKSRLLRPR